MFNIFEFEAEHGSMNRKWVASIADRARVDRYLKHLENVEIVKREGLTYTVEPFFIHTPMVAAPPDSWVLWLYHGDGQTEWIGEFRTEDEAWILSERSEYPLVHPYVEKRFDFVERLSQHMWDVQDVPTFYITASHEYRVKQRAAVRSHPEPSKSEEKVI